MKILHTFLLFLSFACTLQAEWYNPIPGRTQLFVGAPGVLADNAYLIHYATELNTTDGLFKREPLDAPIAFEILDGQRTIGCRFPEIYDEQAPAKPKTLLQKFGSFVGILARFFLAKKEKPRRPYSVIFPKGKLRPFINTHMISLGQETDIAALQKTYQQAIALDPDADIVMFGCSRGAATVVNFIANCYETEPIKNIKAIILEAPFDKLQNCVSKFMYQAILQFTQFKAHGPEPLSCAPNFARCCNAYSIPVLVISSQIDSVVPHSSTKRLVDTFKENGLTNNLYFLTLNFSKHSSYMCETAEDAQLYHDVVHAFYATHGLDHDPQSAERAKQTLIEIK